VLVVPPVLVPVVLPVVVPLVVEPVVLPAVVALVLPVVVALVLPVVVALVLPVVVALVLPVVVPLVPPSSPKPFPDLLPHDQRSDIARIPRRVTRIKGRPMFLGDLIGDRREARRRCALESRVDMEAS
jgi:hypothetical protein